MTKSQNVPSRTGFRLGARLLARLDRWLFGLRFSRFCLLVFALSALQNGVWVVPSIDTFRLLSSDVTRQMTQGVPQADYLYTSFLGLLLGYVTGACHWMAAYALLHLLFLGVGMACLLWAMLRHDGDLMARLFVLAFATTPISNVLLTWLGISDVYVFVFSTALALTESAAWTALFAFLLGLSHFEQGLMIAIGLAAWRVWGVVQEGKPWRAAALPAAALLGGVAVAHLLLNGYFAARGFHFSLTRITYIGGSYWQRALHNALRHFGVMIFSFHGCYWLVISGALWTFWRSHKDLAWMLIGTHVAAAGLAIIALDETRDFSLLIWPFLVLLLRSDAVRMPELRRWAVAAYALGLAAPKLVVWEGAIHSGVLYYDGLFLLSRFTSGPSIFDVPNWTVLPFR